MSAEIYVISGFLGAGKTTLIKKMINEIFKNKRIALIENDFGERSVDAALLKSEAIEIKEINSGCICCSLSGDFKRSLKVLVERFHPDKILIEPSGVGKLSDVVKACSDPSIRPYAEVKAKITVVDVKRCKTYLDNFGEFFEDQIRNAELIFLSRTNSFPDRIIEAKKIINSLNADSFIVYKSWEQVDLNEILGSLNDNRINPGMQKIRINDRSNYCSGRHYAEETFETVTIRTRRIFSKEELKACVQKMERTTKGTILRAKGIVQGAGGCICLQYLPGEIQISACDSDGDMLCIIGRNLNRNELYTIFSGI